MKNDKGIEAFHFVKRFLYGFGKHRVFGILFDQVYRDLSIRFAYKFVAFFE